MNKPVKRNIIRKFFGYYYYFLKKQLYWNFSKNRFVSECINKSKLPHLVFEHKSLLFRKLKNVDDWFNYNKIENLKIAIDKVNNVVIKPGEIFSYWRLIGKPTKHKGYVPGMVLENGQVKVGIGGGLCQLSNLLYWMTLHTTLDVIERWRHSYDVFPDSRRKQPFGSGATCAYPYIDLQIKNNTNSSFYFKIFMNDKYLFGQIYSDRINDKTYKIVEKKHEIKHEWWGEYIRKNEIWRECYQNKTLVSDDFVTKNNAIMMYNPLLEK